MTDVPNDDIQALRAQIADQEHRLARMDGALRRLLGESRDGVTSRRNFVRLAGAGMLGAAGAAALLPRGAEAANGNPLSLGNADSTTNTATNTTELDVTNAGSTSITCLTLSADSGGGGSGAIDGLDSYALNGGYGVYSVSDTGPDLKAGGTGRLGQYNVGTLHGTSPSYVGMEYLTGTTVESEFELVRGENGEIWAALYDAYASSNSLPAGWFWKRVNSARFDKPDGSGGIFVPFRAYDSRVNPGHPIATGSTITVQIAPNGSNAGVSAAAYRS